jgi:DNA recombination protein RmuC
VLCLLIYLLTKTNNKVDSSKNNFEIQKISQNLENLLNKTLEQTGFVNSKIGEIGDLTKKMTNAMTSNISDMGDMGEVILENILEDCGMTKNRDYKTQFTGKNEEGSNFRPDVVVFLPENRNIIIDSKVPMKDWYEFQNTDEKSIRDESIKNFINSIKNHINSIHKKDYKNLLNVNSPDYVFIFMPHEFAFVTAQKYDTTLANYAQQKQIIIVGPSTLIMCMKLIESIWKLEKQNKNSSEIANLAGQMYDQIIKSMNILDDSEKNLMKAVDNVSSAKKFIKDGRSSLYNKAEEMKKLGANSKKELN